MDNTNNRIILADEETANKRLFAGITDSIVLFTLLFLKDQYSSVLEAFIVLTILELSYFCILETLTGYTIGKFLFKIKVVNNHFKKPNLKQSFIRALLRIFEANPITVFIPIINYYFMQKSKTGQRIGDKLAATYVLKTKYINEFKDLSSLDEYNDKMNDFREKLPCYYDNIDSQIYFIKYKSRVRIIGIEDLKYNELVEQINSGKRFVIYSYSLNLLVYMLSAVSPVYFDQNSSKAISARIIYCLLSTLTTVFLLPIIISSIIMLGTIEFLLIIALCGLCIFFSIRHFISNIRGGYDITEEVLSYINKKREIN